VVGGVAESIESSEVEGLPRGTTDGRNQVPACGGTSFGDVLIKAETFQPIDADGIPAGPASCRHPADTDMMASGPFLQDRDHEYATRAQRV
jgi:hypothetical protein